MTPFGWVERGQVRPLMKTAGLIWDNKYKKLSIKSWNIEHWRLNAAEQRLSNEKRWYKGFGFLPLAFNNFKVALLKHEGNTQKAIDMANLFYFKGNTPVYLPDYLCEINGLDSNVRHFTYGRIFREWETLKLTT